MRSLTPKSVLSMQSEMLDIFREILDRMVATTQTDGFVRFKPLSLEIPRRITALPIARGANKQAVQRCADLMDTITTLLFAGNATTSEALPPLIYELTRRPEW